MSLNSLRKYTNTQVLWTQFLSPIKKTPQELDIDLGEANNIHIVDLPVGWYVTPFHKINEFYLKIIDAHRAEIAPFEKDNSLATSQIVAFLDVVLNLSEEEDMSPRFFSKLEVDNQEFHQLDEEFIRKLKKHQKVIAYFNEPAFNSANMEVHQIAFHRANDEPTYGAKYIENSLVARATHKLF